MKQVLQSARTGKLAVEDVPAPSAARPGHLLVRTRASLISAGTERLVTEFARKTLAGKARARPDLVRKVLDKARRDGLAATLKTVLARLDEPLPLGYAAAGEVLAVGEGLEGAHGVGQRVAMAGAGAANHAEINIVPRNLIAPVPEGIGWDEACFATLCAIAMHGVRNMGCGLGDVVAVIGCGLVGQLAVQFAALGGSRVLAIDYDRERLATAARLGAEETWCLTDSGLDASVAAMTAGKGCDGILVAAASDGAEPLETAARVARDRARISLVGLTGTAFPFRDYMQKELSIIVSRSYGPGRYDDDFEGRGVKYPEGFVRWTETENLAESLRLMGLPEGRRLDVGSLITHHFALGDAEAAYGLIIERREPHMGVVLTYGEDPPATPLRTFPAPRTKPSERCGLGVIGAGAFARSVLLPALKKRGDVALVAVASRRGSGAEQARATFGFDRATSDADDILADPAVDGVVIATRHDSHAALTVAALAAGKPVLVEKPLGLTMEELDRVAAARADSTAFFQVGFNRRHSAFARRAREVIVRHGGPCHILIRVNAGPLPAESWILDPAEGGGRIIGELCHFVDLASFLGGGVIRAVQAETTGATGDGCQDVSVSLSLDNGALSTIVYTALGDAAMGKERIEAYAGGAAVVIEDFRVLTVTEGGRSRRQVDRLGQDKGFAGELDAFVNAVRRGGPPPVDEAELLATSRATLAVLQSLREGWRIVL